MKQGTKNRPVFNLKSLNHCVLVEKFKLEGLDMVRCLLAPKDYMMKLDLQDAYFMIPIHVAHKKYLRLEFQGKTYEFQGRFLRSLEQVDSLLSSTSCSDPKDFTKNETRQSNRTTDCTKLAEPTLVSNDVGNVSELFSKVASSTINNLTSICTGTVALTLEKCPVDGTADFKNRLETEGNPGDVPKISWHHGEVLHKKKYEGPWKVWSSMVKRHFTGRSVSF